MSDVPLSFTDMLRLVDSLRETRRTQPDRIEASQEWLDRVEAVAYGGTPIVGQPVLFSIPVIIDPSIPVGWAKVVPVEGDPTWMEFR